MKKNLFIFLALMPFQLMFSQISYGLKGGYTSSNLKFETDGYSTTIDSKSYFYFGGYANYKLQKRLSVQGEILYTEVGGKYEEELTQLVGTEIVTIGQAKLTFKYPQIMVPVSLKYDLLPEKFGVLGGMNFAFNINPRLKSNFTYESIGSGDITNAKTMVFYPFVGIQWQIVPKVSADARYNFRMSNMAESDLEIKSGVFQIGLNYSLQ